MQSNLSTPTLPIRPLILLALTMLLVIGGIFRFYNAGDQSYWMDEGYTINAVLAIQEKGASILDSGLPYSCPIYCYPTSWIADAFGNSAESYRFLAAAAGLIFIGVLFFVTRKLFDLRVALFTSVALTFSYWQIAWSRQARWYTLLALFFWLALYFFHRALYAKEKRGWYAALTVLFTILSILTHGLGYVLPAIFIGWILVDQIFFRKRISLKKGLGVVAALAVAGTVILSFVPGVGLHYELPYYVSFYLRSYWLFVPFILIAFFSEGPYKRELWFLLLAFAAYLIPLSFFTNIVHYRYLFHVAPVLIVLGAVGAVAIYDHIKHSYAKIAYWLLLLAVFFFFAGGVIIPHTDYFLESDNPETLGDRPSYSYTPQPDWNSAYDFIKMHKTADDLVISTQPQFNKIFLGEPGYWIKYNYLGIDSESSQVVNDREYYVGAKVIDDLEELKSVTSGTHGYVVLDFMAYDGKVPEEIISFIQQNELVFHKRTNAVSEVWVYRY